MNLLLAVTMLFAAGLVRGFSGFGFAIAAVPLLSLLAPPADIVPLVVLLQLCISLQGLRPAWAAADFASLRWLAPGAALATPLGLWALAWLPEAPVRLLIAALVGATVAVLAGGWRLPRTPHGAAVGLVGVLSGLCNGLAAMPGPPVIAYYLAVPLPAAAGRGAMIVLFLMTSVAAFVPLLLAGHLPDAVLVVAGLPAVWAGSTLGEYLYRRAPEAGYRRAALWILGAAGVAAAARALI